MERQDAGAQPGGAQPGSHHHGRHSEEHRAQRARLFPVDPILGGLLRSEAEFLADVGCGYGHFTIPAAQRLPRGRVVALDTDAGALDQAREAAAQAGLTNVEFILSEPDRIPLADGSVTAALLSVVLHEVGDKPRLLAEVRRILNPSGRLSVVEFYKQESTFGPPLADRLPPEETEEMLRRAGFRIIAADRLNEALYHVLSEVSPVSP